MLSRSTQLPRLDDAEAQYRVIKNYFDAVKKWQPKAWSTPKEYIMLRGSGLWAICFIGAQVIDRTLLQDEFQSLARACDFALRKRLGLGKERRFQRSRRPRRLEISNRVTRKLQDENRMSTKQLFDKIMVESPE
jgi:hypothetical protein